MTNSIIGTPLYINKNMILDLASGLAEGYLDSTSVRFTAGIAGDKRLTSDYKEQETSEDKLKNTTKDDSSTIDGKADLRREFSNKKVFTTFYFFNNIRDILIERNMLKYITDKDVLNNKIKCGEYIKFSANLSANCAVTPITTLIDIIDSYDPKVLDNLINEKNPGYTTCTSIQKQLRVLCNCLNKNSTTDLIMNLSSSKAILNVNTNYFSDKNACVYDTADSECITLCKVIRVIDKKGNLDLLRKTGISNFYNNFLNL